MGGATFPGYNDYVELLQQCWHQDAEARPTFNDIIKVLRRLLAIEVGSKRTLLRRGSLSSQGSVPTDIMRSGGTEEIPSEIVEVANSSTSNSHDKSSAGEETS